MLRMDDVQRIRHKILVEGQPRRAVARELGIGRNTLKKYLATSEPTRSPRHRKKPVLARVQPRVEALLAEWEGRTTSKQRITAARLYQQLRSEGFAVGYTLIKAYLRERHRREKEVFVPLVHRPGDEGQVDFFEVSLEVDGLFCRVWMFLMHLMFSGYDFVWFYERQDQLSFLDGHVRAFAHFGGVPQRCIYDNLSAAVRKVVLPQRELTARFQALQSHYLFEPCFARPGEGHDKGGVESRGKHLRWQQLTPIPKGSSLSEIAVALLSRLDAESLHKRDAEGKSQKERFEEERGRLLYLPSQPFEARRLVMVSISSKATVQIEGAWYSVPSPWARLSAHAYVGVQDIRLTCRQETITVPKVQPGQKKIQYRHYLPELAKKPQAVRQVAPELLAELGEPYGKLWRLLVDSHGPREAARVLARVLAVITDHGEEAVRQALHTALAAERIDLLALSKLTPPQATPTIALPASLAEYQIESASLEAYDELLRGGDE